MRPTAQDSKKSRHRSGIDIKLRDENRKTRSGEGMYDNSVDERIIKSRADNESGKDSERGVSAIHQKDNSTNSRVLASRPGNQRNFDNERAVSSEHQKDNSTNDRVLASGPTNADRAVDSLHVKDGAIRTKFNNDGSTDFSHLQADSVGRAQLQSHATVDALRAITRDHIRDKAVTDDKILEVSAGKVTKGTLNKARVPELSELRGKIGRVNINYPSHNNEGASRPFVSEMISDNSVGPRIIDLAWLQDYIDSKWARK